jgi:hypothetical protein
MGMFKKLGLGRGKAKEKDEEEDREYQECKRMEQEEELRRACLLLEKEEDERAAMEREEKRHREAEQQKDNADLIARAATPDIMAPLPPAFQALEEINEYSVVRCQAAVRRLLSKRTVEGIRKENKETQMIRDAAAKEAARVAALAATTALGTCQQVVNSALEFNRLLARVCKEAATSAMNAAWSALRIDKISSQATEVVSANDQKELC